MWERSEKHLVIALLFILIAKSMTGLGFAIVMGVAGLHLISSFYHAFKETKQSYIDKGVNGP